VGEMVELQETPKKPTLAENLREILFFYKDPFASLVVLYFSLIYSLIAIVRGVGHEWGFWLTALAVVTSPWVIGVIIMVILYIWPPLKLVWERYYALVNELFERAEQEKKAGNAAHSWAFKLVGFIVAIPLFILLVMVANSHSE
jgi:hypothetical protein